MTIMPGWRNWLDAPALGADGFTPMEVRLLSPAQD
jgi:hypothetical protein